MINKRRIFVMLIIDRFEGEYAILEDNNNHYEIKLSELPKGCKEGDVITTKDGFYTFGRANTIVSYCIARFKVLKMCIILVYCK
jgi:hypothetical protein